MFIRRWGSFSWRYRLSSIEINAPCKACGNPKSLTMFSTVIRGDVNESYCSEDCRKKGRARNNIYGGLLLTAVVLFITISIGKVANFEFGNYLFIFLFFGSPGLYLIYGNYKNTKITIEPRSKGSVHNREQSGDEAQINEIPIPSSTTTRSRIGIKLDDKSSHVPKIHVKELNDDFLVCCYQAARLGKDNYCLCGRVIPKELKEIFVNS